MDERDLLERLRMYRNSEGASKRTLSLIKKIEALAKTVLKANEKGIYDINVLLNKENNSLVVNVDKKKNLSKTFSVNINSIQTCIDYVNGHVQC